MAEPLVVVAGSIAALAAADAALARGRAVEVLESRRGVGGGFDAITVRGRRLPLGVRALELDREDATEPPLLEDYRPGPAGHAPYIRLVAAWVEDLVGDALEEMAAPEMVVGGAPTRDIYFTVDLSQLGQSLGAGPALRIGREAADACVRLGDSGVLARTDTPPGLSLEEASRANHGATFHELLIDSIARKIRPRGCDGVPVDLRRKIWMPVFHPRTVAEAVTGEGVTFRPRRPFHTVTGGGMAAIVDALRARIDERGGRRRPVDRLASIERRAGSRTRLAFADGQSVDATRPIVGLAADELLSAAGADFRPPRAEMVISWVDVPERDVVRLPGLVHLPDPDIRAFRVSTEANGGTHLFTIEHAHDTRSCEIEGSARGILEQSGLVRPGGDLALLHSLSGPAFVDPTAEAVAAFERARARLDGLRLEAEVVGGATAFGADSLNEQIVQGLRAEEATR